MKMKRLAIISVCLMACVALGQLSRSVGPTSVVLLPPANLQAARTWTNTINCTQGMVVDSGSAYYMAVTAGTSTNQPTHAYGDDATSDAVTWYKVPPGRRNGFWVVLLSTGRVCAAFGQTAVDGSGIALTGYGGSFGLDVDNYQGVISAISAAATTNTVIINVW